MGTYTDNYNLFMPNIGEQGWGELVNGNFSTIDTTMAGLNTRMGTTETNITSLTTRMGTAETTIASNTSRIETLETETDTVEARVEKIEENISFDASGNIVGNVVGNVTGNVTSNISVIKNCLKMPLLTSGSARVFSFAGWSVSGQWWSAGWEQVGTFSVPTLGFFHPLDDSVLHVTFTGIVKAANDMGNCGYRILKDGVVVYETSGMKTSTTLTVNISLNYGGSYTVERYMQGGFSTGKDYQASISAVNYYLC